MNDTRIPLNDLVGFDYISALREILKRLTYEEAAYRLGYSSTGGVTAVLKGRVPSHKHGEAIWALYLELFNRKPPLVPVVPAPEQAMRKSASTHA